LLIECFPYLPDLIALVRELASSHKAPSSEELLMKGAMRYAEKQGAAYISVLPPPPPFPPIFPSPQPNVKI
jgi:hypothetical protein